jgi:hypothetical protein
MMFQDAVIEEPCVIVRLLAPTPQETRTKMFLMPVSVGPHCAV